MILLIIAAFIVILVLAKKKDDEKNSGFWKKYGMEAQFARRNNFMVGKKCNKKQLKEIAKFFDKSEYKIFKEFGSDILILYENKNILLYKPLEFWQFIKAENIEDLRVENDGQTFSLGGAVGGAILFGGLGALIGGVKSKKITINVITKGFNSKNYTLVFNDPQNIQEISNILYQLYNK